MISILDISALLLVLSALFGWLNRRFVHLPHTTGLLAMGLHGHGAVADEGARQRPN